MSYKYVLIDAIDVNERDVEHELKKHPNISHVEHAAVEDTAMADPLFENYNIVLKVEGDSLEEIKDIVDSKIRSLPAVKHVQLFSKPNIA